MAKAPVWATLGRLEKKTKKSNIKFTVMGYQKTIEKIPDFMKKIGKKSEGTKTNPRKFQIVWKKLEKKCEGTKTNLDKICRYENFGYIPKKVQIFNVSKKCKSLMFQKSANLQCFKYWWQEYCRQEYWGQEYCPHFWTGMKILSTYIQM